MIKCQTERESKSDRDREKESTLCEDMRQREKKIIFIILFNIKYVIFLIYVSYTSYESNDICKFMIQDVQMRVTGLPLIINIINCYDGQNIKKSQTGSADIF